MTDTFRPHGAGQAAIEHHYDVGNDFFRIWLDESMTYSCALYARPEDTIATAQRRKLEFHRDNLALRQGDSVLDVGCGWGGMLRCLADASIDLDLTGLSLSPAQVEEAQARLGDRATILLGAWEEHDAHATYDAIVSLGAFEHFVRPGLDRSERIQAYGQFFRACFGWLTGEGRRLSLQTIALEDQAEQIGSGLGEFFTSDVFPASSLPRIGEIVAAAEPYFRIVGLRADPDDYARTCAAWRSRLIAAREQATECSSAEVVRHYRKLLLASEVEFASRSCTLYRIAFERRAEGVSLERGRQ
jgi:cyclopropane-fatty-acyl-phospholipid synthase